MNIILLSAGLFLCCLLIVIALSKIKSLQQALKMHEYHLAKLQIESRSLIGADMGLGERFKSMEKQFSDLELRQEEIEDVQAQDSAYTKALKLAKQGANINEIVKACKISRGEAELLMNLHGFRV